MGLGQTLAGGECVAGDAPAGDAAEFRGLSLLKDGQRVAAATRIICAWLERRGRRVHQGHVCLEEVPQ